MYGGGRGGGYGNVNAWGGGMDPNNPPPRGMGDSGPSHGWTTHSAPDGHCYYYNSHTGTSQWERPAELDKPAY